jgi:hypothetical protein
VVLLRVTYGFIFPVHEQEEVSEPLFNVRGCFGDYDTFAKMDDTWLFAERLLYVDWIEERAVA